MDDELTRQCRRWLAADEAGRDDEADAAFKKTFAALPPVVVPAPFTAGTLHAVSAVLAADRRRARLARVAVVAVTSLGTALGLYFGAGWIVSALSTAMVAFLDLVVAVVVKGAAAADHGANLWGVLFGLGRAAAAFLTEPKVTITLLAIQGIAAAALFALQRLLGADAESFK